MEDMGVPSTSTILKGGHSDFCICSCHAIKPMSQVPVFGLNCLFVRLLPFYRFYCTHVLNWLAVQQVGSNQLTFLCGFDENQGLSLRQLYVSRCFHSVAIKVLMVSRCATFSSSSSSILLRWISSWSEEACNLNLSCRVCLLRCATFEVAL